MCKIGFVRLSTFKGLYNCNSTLIVGAYFTAYNFPSSASQLLDSFFHQISPNVLHKLSHHLKDQKINKCRYYICINFYCNSPAPVPVCHGPHCQLSLLSPVQQRHVLKNHQLAEHTNTKSTCTLQSLSLAVHEYFDNAQIRP